MKIVNIIEASNIENNNIVVDDRYVFKNSSVSCLLVWRIARMLSAEICVSKIE